MKKMNQMKTVKISKKIVKMYEIKKNKFFCICKMIKISAEAWKNVALI